MKIRAAVRCGLVIGAAGGFLGWKFLAPLALLGPALPGVPPELPGRLVSATLVALSLYAVTAAAILGAATVVELGEVRARLAAAAPATRREHLTLAEWIAAFAGSGTENLRDRVVSRVAWPEDDRLLLASPLSGSVARTELRAFHWRGIAITQVWTVAAILTAVAVLGATLLPPGVGHQLARLAGIADAAVLASVLGSWMAAALSAEAFIGTLSGLPLMLEAAARTLAVPSVLSAAQGALTRLPGTLAATIRGEAEAILQRLAQTASHSFWADEEALKRLVEGVTASATAALDQRMSGSLRALENLIARAKAGNEELAARLASLPESLSREHASEREEMSRALAATSAADHREIRSTIEILRQLLDDASRTQREDLARLATAVSEAIQGMERDREASHADLDRMITTVEAYTTRLLPAVRRVEASDERVAAALGRQDETLSRLAIAVGELSGTLEALQAALGQSLSRAAPGADTLLLRRRIGNGAESGPVAQELARQIKSLLDEMGAEEVRTPDSATPPELDQLPRS